MLNLGIACEMMMYIIFERSWIYYAVSQSMYTDMTNRSLMCVLRGRDERLEKVRAKVVSRLAAGPQYNVCAHMFAAGIPSGCDFGIFVTPYNIIIA